MENSNLLEVSRELRDGGVVVTARGELDFLTTPQLVEELTAARSAVDEPQLVVVDLRKVAFLGVQGVACLLDTHRSCEQARTPLWVVADGRAVLRPLSALGLAKTFQIADKVEHVFSVSRAEREDDLPR